jgi:hypothetical protein
VDLLLREQIAHVVKSLEKGQYSYTAFLIWRWLAIHASAFLQLFCSYPV